MCSCGRSTHSCAPGKAACKGGHSTTADGQRPDALHLRQLDSPGTVAPRSRTEARRARLRRDAWRAGLRRGRRSRPVLRARRRRLPRGRRGDLRNARQGPLRRRRHGRRVSQVEGGRSRLAAADVVAAARGPRAPVRTGDLLRRPGFHGAARRQGEDAARSRQRAHLHRAGDRHRVQPEHLLPVAQPPDQEGSAAIARSGRG